MVNTEAFQAVLERFAVTTWANQKREIVLVLDGRAAPLKNRHFRTLAQLQETLAARTMSLVGVAGWD